MERRLFEGAVGPDRRIAAAELISADKRNRSNTKSRVQGKEALISRTIEDKLADTQKKMEGGIHYPPSGRVLCVVTRKG